MTSDTRLFVGRLLPSVSKRDLEDLFSRYGKIANCSLKTTYGFVEYEDPRDARDAVRELNGYKLEGSRIAVEYSHGRRRGDRDYGGRRDYDKDYDRDYDRDRDRDRDRDYDDKDKDRDYDRDRDRDRGGDRDYGRNRYSRGRYSPPYNTEFRISVTNLPQGCSWQDLKDHFRQIGEVCFADVRRDHDGRENGIVEFKYLEDMKEAVRKLDKSKLRGSSIYITCEYDGGKSRSRSRSSSGRKRRRESPRRSPRSPGRKRTRSRTRSRSPKSPSKSPERSASPRRNNTSPPARKNTPSPSVSPGKSPRRSPDNVSDQGGDRHRTPSPAPAKKTASKSDSQSP